MNKEHDKQTRPPDPVALCDIDNLQTTREQLEQALQAAESAQDDEYMALTLTQLARVHGLEGHYTKAHVTLDSAKMLIHNTGSRASQYESLERGRVFNSSGDPDKARSCFQQAWDTAQRTGEDAIAADAGHMLAICEPLAHAGAWTERVLQLIETSNDQDVRSWRAPLYNNIGWRYFEASDFQTALEHFQQAVNVRKETPHEPRALRIANYAVATTLRHLGQIEEAIALLKPLISEAEAVGDKPPFIYEELAICFETLGQGEHARVFACKAYPLFAQMTDIAQADPQRVSHLKALCGEDASQ